MVFLIVIIHFRPFVVDVSISLNVIRVSDRYVVDRHRGISQIIQSEYVQKNVSLRARESDLRLSLCG